MIQLTCQPGDFTALQDIFRRLEPPAQKHLLGRIGFNIARQAKANARAMHDKAKRPSIKGGGFWAGVANSISYRVDDHSVTIGAAHYAAAHKQFGGTISAPGKGVGSKGAKFLTIPIAEEAYGHSVGELKSRLDIFRIGNILFGRPKKSKGAIRVIPLYVLKKSVSQKPEPWFPTEAQIYYRISEAIDMHKFM